MTDLKPCPFCGGEGEIIKHGFFNLPSSYGVGCLNCGCATYQFFDTEEEAAEAWNRRHYMEFGGYIVPDELGGFYELEQEGKQ